MTSQPEPVTWAEVVALQEEAEQAELYAHLSDLWRQRYDRAMRSLAVARGRYEEQKRKAAEEQAEREPADPEAAHLEHLRQLARGAS